MEPRTFFLLLPDDTIAIVTDRLVSIWDYHSAKKIYEYNLRAPFKKIKPNPNLKARHWRGPLWIPGRKILVPIYYHSPKKLVIAVICPENLNQKNFNISPVQRILIDTLHTNYIKTGKPFMAKENMLQLLRQLPPKVWGAVQALDWVVDVEQAQKQQKAEAKKASARLNEIMMELARGDKPIAIERVKKLLSETRELLTLAPERPTYFRNKIIELANFHVTWNKANEAIDLIRRGGEAPEAAKLIEQIEKMGQKKLARQLRRKLQITETYQAFKISLGRMVKEKEKREELADDARAAILQMRMFKQNNLANKMDKELEKWLKKIPPKK